MEQRRKINFPADIIEDEILLRLPVKTLSRFKCVCKHWLGLIESRSFIDRHYSRERDDDRLVFRHYDGERGRLMRLIGVDPNQRFPQSENIVELMGPQLGLFCQVTYEGDITLFNPATKMSKRIPPLKVHYRRHVRINHLYGFGLDPLTRDYKIVVFHQPWQEPTTSVHIYNSTSDSWKVIEASRVDSMNGALDSNSKTFVNGVYYWLTRRNDINYRVVLSFDMRIERFGEIQLPHDAIDKRIVQICARDDSLALLAFDFVLVDLWVMGEEGFWSRSFRVGPFLTSFLTWLDPYCVWKNELVLSSPSLNHLILIDVYTKKQSKIYTKKPRKIAIPRQIPQLIRSCMNFTFFFYKESFVSIKGERPY